MFGCNGNLKSSLLVIWIGLFRRQIKSWMAVTHCSKSKSTILLKNAKTSVTKQHSVNYLFPVLFLLFVAVENKRTGNAAHTINNQQYWNMTLWKLTLSVLFIIYCVHLDRTWRILLEYVWTNNYYTRSQRVLPTNWTTCLWQNNISFGFADLGMSLSYDSICDVTTDNSVHVVRGPVKRNPVGQSETELKPDKWNSILILRGSE